jgi:hypothetical protein
VASPSPSPRRGQDGAQIEIKNGGFLKDRSDRTVSGGGPRRTTQEDPGGPSTRRTFGQGQGDQNEIKKGGFLKERRSVRTVSGGGPRRTQEEDPGGPSTRRTFGQGQEDPGIKKAREHVIIK